MITIVYLVIDHEDYKTYRFNTVKEAMDWKNELIDVFETDKDNITVLERKYDKFGNFISQLHI